MLTRYRKGRSRKQKPFVRHWFPKLVPITRSSTSISHARARRHRDISKFPIQKSPVSRPLIVPSTGSPRARKLATPPRLPRGNKRNRISRRRFSHQSLPLPSASRLFLTAASPSPGRDIISRGKKFLMTENLIYIASSRRFHRRSASSFSCN